MVTPTMTFGGTVQAGMPPRSRIPGAEQHHVTQRNLPVHAAQSLQSDLPPRTRSPSARGGVSPARGSPLLSTRRLSPRVRSFPSPPHTIGPPDRRRWPTRALPLSPAPPLCLSACSPIPGSRRGEVGGQSRRSPGWGETGSVPTSLLQHCCVMVMLVTIGRHSFSHCPHAHTHRVPSQGREGHVSSLGPLSPAPSRKSAQTGPVGKREEGRRAAWRR